MKEIIINIEQRDKIENDTVIQSKIDAENKMNDIICNYEIIEEEDIK